MAIVIVVLVLGYVGVAWWLETLYIDKRISLETIRDMERAIKSKNTEIESLKKRLARKGKAGRKPKNAGNCTVRSDSEDVKSISLALVGECIEKDNGAKCPIDDIGFEVESDGCCKSENECDQCTDMTDY